MKKVRVARQRSRLTDQEKEAATTALDSHYALAALWIAFTCPSGVSSRTVQDFAALNRKANVFNDQLNEPLIFK